MKFVRNFVFDYIMKEIRKYYFPFKSIFKEVKGKLRQIANKYRMLNTVTLKNHSQEHRDKFFSTQINYLNKR